MFLNMFRTSFLLIVLPGLALAKDFRTLDYGEDCNDLNQREQVEGSLSLDRIARNTYSYENIHLDRTVRIDYLCDDENRFKRGVYSFEFENIENAIEFYRITQPQLNYRLGEPYNSSVERKNNTVIGMNSYWKFQRSGILLFAHIISVHQDTAFVGINYEKIR